MATQEHNAKYDLLRKIRQSLEQIETAYPGALKVIRTEIEQDINELLTEFIGVTESMRSYKKR